LTTITRTEKRKRGFLGKLFLSLFWIFNGLMLWWMIAALGTTSSGIASATSEAAKAGAAIGSAIGLGLILGIWAAGAIILGVIVALTPGKTIVVETMKER
jgi:hypothetical protein